MKDILHYIQRWAPAGAPEAAGCPWYDIEDLEEAAGGPPTGAHHELLRTMGKSTGPLQVAQANFTLEKVLDCYALLGWTPPAGVVWLALDEDPLADTGYFLDLARPHGEDDCAVLLNTKPELDQGERRVCYRSLREMLMHWTVFTLRLPQHQHHVHLVAPYGAEVREAQVQQALAGWFPEPLPHFSCNLGFDDERHTALLERDPKDERLRGVRLGAQDPRELQHRVAVLRDQGLQPEA